MIAMATLSIVLGAVALAALQGQDAYKSGRMVSDLETRARRAVDQMVDDLRTARRAGLVPDPLAPWGSATLDFQRNEGYGAGGVTWSAPVRLANETDDSDGNDGLDNDSDGLVDEGSVVRRVNPGAAGESRVVLVNWVRELLEGETANGLDDNGNGLIDEAGLCFESDGDTLTIRLTLERPDATGALITRTVETAVTLKN
jgi:hypothetical protein